MNETDYFLQLHLIEPILERLRGTFSRESFAPVISAEHPSKFQAWPTHGVKQSDSTHQFACCSFLNCPDAVASQVPMAEDHSHLSPRLPALERFAIAEVASHLGIGADECVLFEIFLAEHAQDQAFRFQGCHCVSLPEP